MSMKNFMQDLMKDQNVSEVCIIHDASFSSLPNDDPFLVMGSSNHSGETFQSQDSFHAQQSSQLAPDDSSSSSSSDEIAPSQEHDNIRLLTSSPGRLVEFRERHKRLKEALSPIKVYKWSPVAKENTPSASIIYMSSTSSRNGGKSVAPRRVDNLLHLTPA